MKETEFTLKLLAKSLFSVRSILTTKRVHSTVVLKITRISLYSTAKMEVFPSSGTLLLIIGR